MTGQPEVWFYAGKRRTSKGQLADAWATGRLEDGQPEVLLYLKVPGIAIGSPYVVQVERADGRTSVIGTPTFDRDTDVAPEEQVVAWRSHDAIARAEDANLKAERRAARDDTLVRDLGYAIAHVERATTRRDAQAVARRITMLVEEAAFRWQPRSKR